MQCRFCFARLRGGSGAAETTVLPADPERITRALDRAVKSTPRGAIGEFLRRRVPVHFGGMSDPFQRMDVRYRVTSRVLEALVRHGYPTVISTRSALVVERPYIDLLRSHPFLVVQFSFSTLNSENSARLEPGAAGPENLLRAMSTLADAGVTVTARWQPYIPGVSPSPSRMIQALAAAGARHVSFEHLKIPVERQSGRWRQVDRMGNAGSLTALYQRLGAYRDGRDMILPARAKLAVTLLTRSECHKHGLTFGAADNDIQYLSDTDCCCSGVDQFRGFENWFSFQIGTAIRRSIPTGTIRLTAIADEWVPEAPIDRHLNSRSRLSTRSGVAGTIADHISHRWESLTSPHNPTRYFGIKPYGRDPHSGTRQYRLDPGVAQLLR